MNHDIFAAHRSFNGYGYHTDTQDNTGYTALITQAVNICNRGGRLMQISEFDLPEAAQLAEIGWTHAHFESTVTYYTDHSLENAIFSTNGEAMMFIAPSDAELGAHKQRLAKQIDSYCGYQLATLALRYDPEAEQYDALGVIGVDTLKAFRTDLNAYCPDEVEAEFSCCLYDSFNEKSVLQADIESVMLLQSMHNRLAAIAVKNFAV